MGGAGQREVACARGRGREGQRAEKAGRSRNFPRARGPHRPALRRLRCAEGELEIGEGGRAACPRSHSDRPDRPDVRPRASTCRSRAFSMLSTHQMSNRQQERKLTAPALGRAQAPPTHAPEIQPPAAHTPTTCSFAAYPSDHAPDLPSAYPCVSICPPGDPSMHPPPPAPVRPPSVH